MRSVALLLALGAMAVSGTALAEGRNDPFLKCDFDKGREVILSERGEEFVWTENGKGTRAAILKRLDNDPRVTIYTYLPYQGAQMLTLNLDIMTESTRAATPPGSALIVTTVIARSGALTTVSYPGRCVELIR